MNRVTKILQRWRLVSALTIVTIAAGLGAAVWVLSSSDSAGEDNAESVASAPPAASSIGSELDEGSEEGPGSDSLGAGDDLGSEGHINCPIDVEAKICELVASVESGRNRPFKTFPVVEIVDEPEFDQRLREASAESIPDIEVASNTYRALGWIMPQDNLADLLDTMNSISVVGYYESEEKHLVIQGGDLDLYSQLVIVHELTHAHDDQWLGIFRPELDDLDNESAYGLLNLIEGNASRVEREWRDSLSSSDERKLAELESSIITPDQMRAILSLPRFLLTTQIAPYTDGLVLIEEIFAAGGESAVDAAFADPPTTSEQVLHPDQYLAGDRPSGSLPTPSADGSVLDDGIIGELVFREWFGGQAAAGWAADHYVTWEQGKQICTRVEVEADSERDLSELADAAKQWAAQKSERTSLVVGDLLRMTGCVD